MDDATRSAIGQLGHEMRAGFERMGRYFEPWMAEQFADLRMWVRDLSRRVDALELR